MFFAWVWTADKSFMHVCCSLSGFKVSCHAGPNKLKIRSAYVRRHPISLLLGIGKVVARNIQHLWGWGPEAWACGEDAGCASSYRDRVGTGWGKGGSESRGMKGYSRGVDGGCWNVSTHGMQSVFQLLMTQSVSLVTVYPCIYIYIIYIYMNMRTGRCAWGQGDVQEGREMC